MKEKRIENDSLEIDLWSLCNNILKKFWIILVVAAIFATTAFVYNVNFVDKTYRSSTTIYILDKRDSNNVDKDFNLSWQIKSDIEQLIRSKTVLYAVIDEMNLNMSTGQLAGMISVNAIGETRLTEISVISNDPKLSCDIANTVSRIGGKKIKEIMKVDAVNIVDKAEIAPVAVGPRIKSETIKAALIGFVLTTVILAIKFIVDDSIRTSEDIKSRLGLTVLGTIPYEGDPNLFKDKNWKKKLEIIENKKKRK